jgi:hypothetical protein
LNSKSAEDVLSQLKSFVREYKPASLTSDEEKACISKIVLKSLEKHHVDGNIITEQRHTALSILDRFVRTIRDYGRKNKPFTDEKLKHFIKDYNNSEHSGIGMKPVDMTKEKELEYIYFKLQQQGDIESQKGYQLKIGNKVRYIEPRKALRKTRYKVTPFYYVITDIEGSKYTLEAQDGSVRTATRFQLIPVKADELNIKQAKTIGGTSRGSVVEIIKFYPKQERYKVKFEGGDGVVYDKIPARELRAEHPLRMSKIEQEFFAKK